MQAGHSAATASLDVAALQTLLQTSLLGRDSNLLYLPVVGSTNTLAMNMAQEGAQEGLVVLTDSQIAGKGRQGRRWVDTSGCNVLLSILLRPLFPPHFLVMLASLAVVSAIRKTCDLPSSIKWPNDVLVHDRKVAGILIETTHIVNTHGNGHLPHPLVAILGIGVNVNGLVQSLSDPPGPASPPIAPLSATAITLQEACGHHVNREHFIAHLLHAVELEYLALQGEAQSPLNSANTSGSRSIHQRWRSQLSTPGRDVTVHQGASTVSGRAEDVDDDGALLLRRHSGELIRITWGEIGYLPR